MLWILFYRFTVTRSSRSTTNVRLETKSDDNRNSPMYDGGEAPTDKTKRKVNKQHEGAAVLEQGNDSAFPGFTGFFFFRFDTETSFQSVFLVGASVSLLAYMRNIISSRPDGSPEKVTDSVVNCLWFLSAIIAGTQRLRSLVGTYLLVSGIFATDDIISDGTKTQSLSKPIFTGVVAIVLKNAMFGTVEDMTRILPMLSVALLTSGILVLCWAEMHTEVAIVITLSFFFPRDDVVHHSLRQDEKGRALHGMLRILQGEGDIGETAGKESQAGRGVAKVKTNF